VNNLPTVATRQCDDRESAVELTISPSLVQRPNHYTTDRPDYIVDECCDFLLVKWTCCKPQSRHDSSQWASAACSSMQLFITWQLCMSTDWQLVSLCGSHLSTLILIVYNKLCMSTDWQLVSLCGSHLSTLILIVYNKLCMSTDWQQVSLCGSHLSTLILIVYNMLAVSSLYCINSSYVDSSVGWNEFKSFYKLLWFPCCVCCYVCIMLRTIFGAVILTESLREFTWFTRWIQSSAQVAADLWTKPTDLSHKSTNRQLRHYIHHCHLLLLSPKADTHFIIP